MSICGRRVPLGAAIVAAAALLMGGGALVGALTRTPDREIPLVVRGMAFYLEGDSRTANPTLRLTPGERVRIVVRNQERGILHDFAIPSFGQATDLLKFDQTGAVTFDVPEAPGTYEYHCTPHKLMMTGRLIVG